MPSKIHCCSHLAPPGAWKKPPGFNAFLRTMACSRLCNHGQLRVSKFQNVCRECAAWVPSGARSFVTTCSVARVDVLPHMLLYVRSFKFP